MYLAQKTLEKKSKKGSRKACHKCHKMFARLDTHLKNSATCKSVASSILSPPPPISSDPLPSPSLDPHTPTTASTHPTPSPPPVPNNLATDNSTSHPNQLPPFGLPRSSDAWIEADEILSTTVVPAVLSAPTVDEKNRELCEGVYQYFSQKYGTKRSFRTPRKRPRKHARCLKTVTKQKNEARKQMRKASREGCGENTIRTLANEFHKLLRLHSKEKKAQLKSRVRMEALKARKECAKAFWRFAAKILDDEGENSATPTFSAEAAESHFRKIYSCEAKTYTRPDWLPPPPSPTSHFNEDPISLEEVVGVIRHTKAKSSPSPNDRVSYQVLKRCPSLVTALLDLYNTCWSSGVIPAAWRQGVIRLIPKSSAADNPNDPGNFRFIALTSCIGKVFTTVLKNRWLTYMIDNGYMDTAIQKAFIDGVPGCTEHQWKLATIIHEARKKHRSLAVCWLDLANAYGSVHHQLIHFTLNHYHAPSKLTNTVASLYSGLNATITAEGWTTPVVPLEIGVYQGDPFSIVIFNTVMCTLIEALKPLQHLGYTLSQSQHPVNLLQYADDTCLVGDGPASCQHLLQSVEKWLQWTGMKAKVPKCHSLGIQASSGKPHDPTLSLGGQSIPFIGEAPIKFLGSIIQVPLNTNAIRGQLFDKLKKMLQKVDETPVTRQQKLLLYRAGICPRISWDLAVNEFPLTWVTSVLEAQATKYLKKWSGLAKSADPSRLYLPKAQGGLGLPSISLIYKKQQVSQACQLLSSRDPVVRHVASLEIQREEALQRPKLKPMLIARDALSEDPGASRSGLKNRASKAVVAKDTEMRINHARSLEHQGDVHRAADEEASSIWASTITSLPSEQLKFALNASQDTLPHNANLSRWKNLPSSCKLCGERQTLHHVLNHCPVALGLRRYNQRHDAVLGVISDFASAHLPVNYHLIADLPEYPTYIFPPHIASTDLRPDLVIWNDVKQEVWLIELTICFETNFDEAQFRKGTKYLELVEAIRQTQFRAHMVPIQVGSRGFLDLRGLKRLRHLLPCQRKDWSDSH